MGGPGGLGRGNRRGPPMSEDDREAERKRRMEERKCSLLKPDWSVSLKI